MSLFKQHMVSFRRLSMMALLAFVISLAAMYGAWRLAKDNERAHIHRMTLLAASAVRADLVSDVQSWVQEQEQLARLWEVDGPSQSEWAAYANLYIEHHPGCVRMEWLNATGKERWTVSAKGDDEPRQQRLEGDAARERMLNGASQSRAAQFSSIFTSPEGRKQWLVAAPIYRQGAFHGFVIGAFDVQQSLDTMLDDIKELRFSAALEENGTEIYRLPGSTDQHRNEWEQAFAVPFPGTAWRLAVWPTRTAMLDLRSNLPQLVLLIGPVFVLLLAGCAQVDHELRVEIKERCRMEEALQASKARFAGILEISASGVISTDDQQRITLFNHAAESMFGYKATEALGQQLEILLPKRFREMHRKHFVDFARSDRRNLLMSKRGSVVGLRKDGTEFPMAASISKLELDGNRILTVLCNDITEQVRAAEDLQKARDELESRVRERTADLERANVALQSEIATRKAVEEEGRQLSAKLIRVQDEERRHLGRELHDGATQNLVAVALNLRSSAMAGLSDNPQGREKLEECLRLIEQSTTELRTISYLLHPPLLEELGLVRTLRGYIEGFTQRSGINMVFTAIEDLGAISSELELTMFRIVQEALSNIHRHSRSTTASITLARIGQNVHLEIADHGIGIPPGRDCTGVGLASMRERVRLLNGTFDIATGSSGTILVANLPVEPSRPCTNISDRPRSAQVSEVQNAVHSATKWQTNSSDFSVVGYFQI